MTLLLRSGFCAGVILSTWTAAFFGGPAAAEPVQDKSWQVAQAPQQDEEEQRRKGRDQRSNERQERREEPRRPDRPQQRPSSAPQERRQAPQPREAQPQRPVQPQKEARPPVQPSILNERRTGDGPKENEQQRARQREILDQRLKARDDRKDARDERLEDKKDVRDDRREERRDDRKDGREERREDKKDVREDRRDTREDRRDDRKDVREERREDKKDVREDRRDTREDRRDDRKDVREERREDKKDAREDRRDVREERSDDRAERQIRRLDDLKQLRRQRVEDGGRRVVIEEPDKRLIVREQGRTIIRHDETERFRRRFKDTRVERRHDGSTETVFIRPDGVHIITVVDSHGRLLRRYRRHRDGRIVVLIDNRRFHRPGLVGGLILGAFLDLRPPVIRIPREQYIVDYDNASYDDVYDALSAPPVEELERGYSLDEVRYNHGLRERMRRIDLDSINFEFGSWEVTPDQYGKLERVAKAINEVLERNPDEIIMIEGYTDAVGTEEDNMTLSDHRAEAVAMVLSDEFGVPPENFVTQGYGEQFLKIETEAPERANRRVAVRRITPLLSRSEQ